MLTEYQKGFLAKIFYNVRQHHHGKARHQPMAAKERIEKKIGSAKAKEIHEFTAEAIKNNGITHYARNQLALFSIPDNLCNAIFQATSGHTDVSGKRFALEASKLYHEIKSHSGKAS